MCELTSIFVQVTTACNAACLNCPHPFTYGSRGKHAKGHMAESVWQKIVDDIADMNFRGGVDLYLHCEPLLDKGLASKIRDINTRTGAYAVLSTNGYLLTDARIGELIESRPRRVHVNINSADREQYEALMGIDYDTVISNTRRFIDRAGDVLEIEINCPVMPGVDTEKLVALFPGVKVNVEYWANSRAGLLPGISSRGKNSRFKIISNAQCTLPRTSLNILHDGSLLVCCMDWAHVSKPCLPDITEVSLKKAHEHLLLRSLYDDFSRGDYTRFSMCALCADEMQYFRNEATKRAAAERLVQMGV